MATQTCQKKERPSDLAPDAVRGELVENVVVELNRICKAATFDFAMKVGRLIIETCYAGQLDSWRKRGAKSVSFRKLAQHPDLPMSPSALYRSVAIYEVCTRLGVESWRHVSTSHIRLVLGLPSHEQASLLQTTEDKRWSVRRLRDAVEALRNGDADGEAKPDADTEARFRNTVRMMSACLDATGDLLGDDEEDVSLSSETARSFADVIHRLRDACTTLEDRLQRHLVKTDGDVVEANGDAQNSSDGWHAD
jgi:hypothetical protein